MNNVSTSVCANYAPYNSANASYPLQLSYVINSAVTVILTIPAVILNVVVIAKYAHLPAHEKRSNTKFLILTQALNDLFNGLINTPLLAIGNVIYYTNLIQSITHTREATCPYWYIISSWTWSVFILSSLLVLVLVAMDRFIAVWFPLYWYSKIRDGHMKLRHCFILIWIFSVLFSLGEVYAHYMEFFHASRSRKHADVYHHILTITCLFMTVFLITIWALTFGKILQTLWQKPFSPDSHEDMKRRNGVSQIEAQRAASNHLLSPYFSTRRNAITPSSSQSSLSQNSLSPSETSNSHLSLTECTTQHHHRKSLRRHRRHMQRRSATTSKPAICAAEAKLVRIFAAILVFFLVGYLPILVYLVVRLVHTGSFSASDDFKLHLLYSVGTTALHLASCLNPLLVLVRVESFKWKSSRER